MNFAGLLTLLVLSIAGIILARATQRRRNRDSDKQSPATHPASVNNHSTGTTAQDEEEMVAVITAALEALTTETSALIITEPSLSPAWQLAGRLSLIHNQPQLKKWGRN